MSTQEDCIRAKANYSYLMNFYNCFPWPFPNYTYYHMSIIPFVLQRSIRKSCRNKKLFFILHIGVYYFLIWFLFLSTCLKKSNTNKKNYDLNCVVSHYRHKWESREYNDDIVVVTVCQRNCWSVARGDDDDDDVRVMAGIMEYEVKCWNGSHLLLQRTCDFIISILRLFSECETKMKKMWRKFTWSHCLPSIPIIPISIYGA